MRQAQTETRQVHTEILNRLDHFTRMQNISVIALLKVTNKDHDGVQLTLNIIPFADGSMPTQHPHNLPPLDHRLIDTVKVMTFLRLVNWVTSGLAYEEPLEWQISRL
ncbi:hypothetical protein V1506DRAFT_546719 [Lipomyces tetrasporus]